MQLLVMFVLISVLTGFMAQVWRTVQYAEETVVYCYQYEQARAVLHGALSYGVHQFCHDRVLQKKVADTSHLPVITCLCGAEILLVPNVKKMNEAIEAHILEHTKKLNAKEAEAEAERIRSDLIIKVLEKASEM